MASTFYSGQASPTHLREPGRVARPMSLIHHDAVRRDIEPARQVDPGALSALIECEVIPRLMGAHRMAMHAGISGEPVIDADEVRDFAPMTLVVEADELLEHVEGLLARGISADAVLLDLLAPAARTLGQYWEDDRCDFIDVTMGLWRLQEVVYELGARIPAATRRSEQSRCGLFAPVPGDQHSFGPLVIEQVFARAGWTTDRLSEPSAADLCERVASEWFDVAGLTGSSECHIGALPSVIAAMRAVSFNPNLRVMVGGPVFLQDPALVERVGADGTAPDARSALAVAEQLICAVAREAGI